MRKSVGQAPTAEWANKRKKKSVGQAPTAERANKRKKKVSDVTQHRSRTGKS